ncbi:MAG: hypothetical protein ABF242_00365, partial [Flavobacteriales bacterium]
LMIYQIYIFYSFYGGRKKILPLCEANCFTKLHEVNRKINKGKGVFVNLCETAKKLNQSTYKKP